MTADHLAMLVRWAAIGAVLMLVAGTRTLERVERWLKARSSATALVALGCALVVAAGVGASWRVIFWVSAALRPVANTPGPVESFQNWTVETLFGGFGLWVLLMARRKSPRWGWAWLGGVATVAIFCAVLIPPVALSPHARGDRPASGASAAAILAFVHKGGLPARSLFVFKSADPVAVDMEGLGPWTHAAVSSAALTAPKPETYAAIGHLLGHYRHGDLWSLASLWSAFAVVFFAAVWAVCAWRERRTSDGDAQNAPTIALAALVAWSVMLVGAPVFNLFDQAINYRADDYALSLTRDPVALQNWLIATQQEADPDPSPLESLLFYDHPPLTPRLANVWRWSAKAPL